MSLSLVQDHDNGSAPVPQDRRLQLRLAATAQDRLAAQRLRYDVFVAERGGDGVLVDHTARLERDRFDEFCDHLLLIDPARDPESLRHVVGAYRLMDQASAARAGGFYSAAEYDLSPLIDSGRRLLELGRSCVHPDYRGGTAVFLLWNGLADYALSRGIDLLFGVASFPGTDVQALAQPLSWLHHHHLAPSALRPGALGAAAHRMDLLPPEALNRAAALDGIPALIRSYLRLGGSVGEGAFVDHAFNTTDVLLLLDVAAMASRRRGLQSRHTLVR